MAEAENVSAVIRPAAARRERKDLSDIRVFNADAMAWGSPDGTMMLFSAVAYSLTPPQSVTITGTPHAIASRGGRPKPSENDVNKNTSRVL
jgi:hypothetical protein